MNSKRCFPARLIGPLGQRLSNQRRTYSQLAKGLIVGLAMMITGRPVLAQNFGEGRTHRIKTAKDLAHVGLFVGGGGGLAGSSTPMVPASRRVVEPIPKPWLLNRVEADAHAVAFQKQRAAEGSDSAALELAKRYSEGRGVDKDPAQARRYLEQAAAAGNEEAQRLLKAGALN
jgi:TPR repeat protein